MDRYRKEMLKVLVGSMVISAGLLYLLDRITPGTVLISGMALLVAFTGGMLSLKNLGRKKRPLRRLEPVIVRTDSILEGEAGRLRCMGTVYGESIIAATMVNDLYSNIKILFGGEPKGYKQIMSAARRKAVERMVRQAGVKGALIVTGHRLTTTQVSDRSAEIISYGTAWKRIS
ncbi:MAG: heavy metal-binding domain-containing protein [Candidatus Thermoplasmatota archaeon]|nr:heavy metal-binding domain-containing protein [Candidatus Thermoplasmatota archaeon]